MYYYVAWRMNDADGWALDHNSATRYESEAGLLADAYKDRFGMQTATFGAANHGAAVSKLTAMNSTDSYGIRNDADLPEDHEPGFTNILQGEPFTTNHPRLLWLRHAVDTGVYKFDN